MATIAFIGLGNMGGPMAINLVKAGHQVTVFDLVPAAVKTVTDLGASSADTANGAAKGAEFVITMLPASRHVESVYLGDNGLLAAVDGDAVVRSEEHTSELQSRENLVCRLLLEKKK